MNQQVFVPVTDDMVYNHPELIEGPLIPYDVGMECQNWLSIEINPDESEPLAELNEVNKDDLSQPNLRLVYSA
jgi:hypothetical protein